jgi:hypothetical protein
MLIRDKIKCYKKGFSVSIKIYHLFTHSFTSFTTLSPESDSCCCCRFLQSKLNFVVSSSCGYLGERFLLEFSFFLPYVHTKTKWNPKNVRTTKIILRLFVCAGGEFGNVGQDWRLRCGHFCLIYRDTNIFTSCAVLLLI